MSVFVPMRQVTRQPASWSSPAVCPEPPLTPLHSHRMLRARLKIRRGPVFAGKAGWRGGTTEHTLQGSVTEEQRSQAVFPAKTLRATGLLREAFVGSTVTARCGDAPVSPSRPRTKSLVAGPFLIFRRALSVSPKSRAGDRVGPRHDGGVSRHPGEVPGPGSLRDRSSLHEPVSHNDALPRSPAMQNVGQDQHPTGEGAHATAGAGEVSPRRFRIRHVGRWLAALGVALAFLPSVSVASDAETNAPAGGDFSAFSIIAERNIFNPSRASGKNARRAEAPAARVDTVALVGTMSYDKGRFAFFDGSDSEYRKVLAQGGTIAGYTIAEIHNDAVKLENDGKVLELKVRSRLRREDGGEWHLDTSAGPYVRAGGTDRKGSRNEMSPGRDRYAGRGERGRGGGDRNGRSSSSASSGSTSAPATTSTASGGEVSDALKRLMEKREKELK